MLTPEQLQLLPVELTELYSELSEFVLRDIARRISEGAKITDTAEYQLYRTRALGLSTKEITAKIAEINGVSADEVEQIILSAAKRSDEFDRRMLGAEISEDTAQITKLAKAQIRNANGAVDNLTGTLGFAERGADGKVIYSSMTDYLRKHMDMAQMKVAAGVTDHVTAMRQECSRLAASGLRTVYYESGHSDRIEVAVRRAMMTSVSQVTQQISELNAEEFGADGWEISAHSGARPSHAIYQGRQYPQSDYERIVLPLIDDFNCRHSAYPIILGITQPAYTEEELKNLDPPPFVYEGRRYTAYEAQQQMRFMERQMRKQKDRCIVADAAGDKEAFTAHSIKLRRQKDIYENFCEAAGTYTEYERTVVMGYNRHLSGKTGAVTRKNRAFERAQMRLTDADDGGIIKTGSDDVALEYQRYGRNKNTLVNKTYIDSGEYRRKYDKATDNPKVNKALYDKAKTALKHRSGTAYEDMYWIDADSGEIVASEINSTTEQLITYSETTKKVVSSYEKKKLVAIHTHPNSMPPSAADFNSCYRNGYKCGLIACHNGRVFIYTSDQEISEDLYSLYINSFVSDRIDEYEAQLMTLNKLKENHLIDFWEVT